MSSSQGEAQDGSPTLNKNPPHSYQEPLATFYLSTSSSPAGSVSSLSSGAGHSANNTFHKNQNNHQTHVNDGCINKSTIFFSDPFQKSAHNTKTKILVSEPPPPKRQTRSFTNAHSISSKTGLTEGLPKTELRRKTLFSTLAHTPAMSSYTYTATSKPIIRSWASSSHNGSDTNANPNSTSASTSTASTTQNGIPYNTVNTLSGSYMNSYNNINANDDGFIEPRMHGSTVYTDSVDSSSSSSQLHAITYNNQHVPVQRSATSKTTSHPTQSPSLEMKSYLICDSIITDLLKSEPNCTVVQEDVEIQGYEIYIVEQWACERKLNRVIVSYTGNPTHKALVNIVALPHEKAHTRSASNTSPQLNRRKSIFSHFPETACSYFEELFNNHAHPKSNDKGIIYVSNLSSFPSNLNLIRVPNGNLKMVWNLFGINENLKRTGCSGRSVLSLAIPTATSEDKFRQIFKIHEKVHISYAVRELIILLQLGLFYFDLLKPQYIDGLLCNETLKAANTWWDRYGLIRFQIRYSDRQFLQPQTVAGIIGVVTGVRNRIASILGNSKTCKDPFDIEYFLETVRQFQKHQHLSRTMKLDPSTIETLYSLTSASGGSGNESNVPVNSSGDKFFGMVKSTVKEVSGKTNQGITDVETLDINRMKDFLQGARTRYLWLNRGSPRKLLPRHTPTTLALGIPLDAFSPTELLATNESKWAIPRRGLPSSKKITDVPSHLLPVEDQKLVSPPGYLNPPRVNSPTTYMPNSENEKPSEGYSTYHGSNSIKNNDHIDPLSERKSAGEEFSDGRKHNSSHEGRPRSYLRDYAGSYNESAIESSVESVSDTDANDRSDIYNDSDFDEANASNNNTSYSNFNNSENGNHVLQVFGDLDKSKERGHSFDTDGNTGILFFKANNRFEESEGNNSSLETEIRPDNDGSIDFHRDHKIDGIESLIGRFHSSSKKMEEALLSDYHYFHQGKHKRNKSRTKSDSHHKDLFKKYMRGSKHRGHSDGDDPSLKVNFDDHLPPGESVQGSYSDSFLSPDSIEPDGESDSADFDSFLDPSKPADDENESDISKVDGIDMEGEGEYDADEEDPDYFFGEEEDGRPAIDMDLSSELLRVKSEPALFSMVWGQPKSADENQKNFKTKQSKDSSYSIGTSSSSSSLNESPSSILNTSSTSDSQRPIWQTVTYRTIRSPSHKIAVLKRSQSFSLIEDHLEYGGVPHTGPLEFSRVPIKVYRSYQVSQALSFKVQQNLNYFDHERIAYNILDNKVRNVLENSLQTKTKNMSTEIQSIVQKEAAIKKGLTELETLTARLQYEARTLDLKLRDIEETALSFTNKVDSLEDRMRKLNYENYVHENNDLTRIKGRKEKQSKSRKLKKRTSSSNIKSNASSSSKSKSRKKDAATPAEETTLFSNIKSFFWGTLAATIPGLAANDNQEITPKKNRSITRTKSSSRSKKKSRQDSQISSDRQVSVTSVNGSSTSRENKVRRRLKLTTPITPINEDAVVTSEDLVRKWETPFVTSSEDDDEEDDEESLVYDDTDGTTTDQFSPSASTTVSSTASPVMEPMQHRFSSSSTSMSPSQLQPSQQLGTRYQHHHTHSGSYSRSPSHVRSLSHGQIPGVTFHVPHQVGVGMHTRSLSGSPPAPSHRLQQPQQQQHLRALSPKPGVVISSRSRVGTPSEPSSLLAESSHSLNTS
ncbi:uncharacterized protein SAPINGB_P001781 [Magnusiomyces paraingens]|uniref:STB6-like N-terminal domain-containing protein n=1 Tax=Magnusiomyces paraingens TaxID=2606893 RepID=A0A5E8BG80_9ASCO|nr:uncharacterized protein SAPINGB_P001781 [Saprochaete ingens]VVT48442.1 unnamed protein product [Saprochaete ingens]